MESRGSWSETREGPKLRTLDDLQIDGRRVLVRADLNIPRKDEKVADERRIRGAAHTIEEGS